MIIPPKISNSLIMENYTDKIPDYPPLKDLFKKYHLSEEILDDEYIDELIGITPKKDRLEDYHSYQNIFGVEQFIYEGTPYSTIREFLRIIKPSKDDIVYDLGSGYGRIIFYGALTTPAFYKGVEILPERIASCNKIRTKLKLKNAEFISRNVLEDDFKDGSVFFLFNPFYMETLEKVGEKLKKIARTKKITIASWGGTSDEYFEEQHWLKPIYPEEELFYNTRLRIFTSTRK